MVTHKEYLDLVKECSHLGYKKDRTEEENKEFETMRNQIREYNKALILEYPFLMPHNRWTDEVDKEFDYQYSELDVMPDGWRIAFADDLLKELKEELVKFGYLDNYRILQIKEKFGTLRWYDAGYPIGKLSDVLERVEVDNWEDKPSTVYDSNVHWTYLGKINDRYVFERRDIIEKCKVPDIISKYEKLSYKTCIICGKPAKYISRGWISPYCEDCAKEIMDRNNEHHRKTHNEEYSIDEYFTEVEDD